MIAAAVNLYDTRIGTLTWDAARELGVFEYDGKFLRSGIQVSPLMLPLRPGTFAFPTLPRETFKGLPGLLADSLPDRFGNLLIDQWLASQGRAVASFHPVERLCYLGTRGMGALEFQPATRSDAPDELVEIGRLVELANAILSERDHLRTKLGSDDAKALASILRVGTSAGGARAKAVIAWNPVTHEVRSGQTPMAPGFEPWLLKFDGVHGNRDKELTDPKGFGKIEYAYHCMARAAGITMHECRLLHEHGRAHFMAKRFDRNPAGGKIHMQTLCAIAHFDFNQAGAYSYEQAFQIARRLNLTQAEITELFRRAVFNIIARNQDDHTKNLTFLMHRDGSWVLAPAYDLTYSYNPGGAWTSRHQMTLNGKRDDFQLADFMAAAKQADIKARKATTVIDQIHDAVGKWPSFAAQAKVSSRWTAQIADNHRLASVGGA
ncbi:MAG: type II toxin-antitoxin system HipA family toxin [Verrucomicrobia bacterium]|nr:type II toxin-antitoxin system HipA family toxin [Verrucomicrobiota bacterium]